jgi:hypothetical protein
VEEKGYKRIMNLPDQENIQYIFIKSEKHDENERNYLPEKGLFFYEAMNERIIIL